MASTPKLLEFDEPTFRPMGIMPVRHRLSDHPLLQLPQIVALAKRLSPKGAVRYHNDSASAGTNFEKAPELLPVEGSVDTIIDDIENCRAWIALHDIQQDPLYRNLVDNVLDDVQPRVERHDPSMHHRAGWIFVTAPGAVTPYHMDHEHNFILQIRGQKTVHVFDALDRQITSARTLELFHRKWSREGVIYQPGLQSRAHSFECTPGDGAYMPTTSPHWVKNGPDLSITASFTYYSDETRRRERLYKLNHELRRFGISPPDVGQKPTRDWLTNMVMKQAQRVAGGLRRLKRPRGL